MLALAVVCAQAKPSLPLGLHGVPAHLDLVPPVLPPAHFHAAGPAAFLPHHHHAKLLPPAHFHAAPLVPAPAPLLPAPAPLLPAPAPLLPAPAPLVPAPAPLLPAPAPLLPAPVVHTHAHVVPAATPILPPVLEAVPFVEPLPTYRAIPGPKTTTHHVSVGYAFPHRVAKLQAVSHAHVHALPHHAHVHHAAPLTLAHHHHHTLF